MEESTAEGRADTHGDVLVQLVCALDMDEVVVRAVNDGSVRDCRSKLGEAVRRDAVLPARRKRTR